MNNEYVIVGGELYHFGVKGMRWGHRKAQKFADKARVSRESADEWDAMAKDAAAKGDKARAAKYQSYAKKDRKDADSYDRDASREAKAKAKIANESAKEWDEMADYAQKRGNMKKANKYREYAQQDRDDAASLSKFIKENPKKVSKGKQAVAKKLSKKPTQKKTKEQYRKEYMEGKNFLQKAWIMYSGEAEIYADIMAGSKK